MMLLRPAITGKRIGLAVYVRSNYLLFPYKYKVRQTSFSAVSLTEPDMILRLGEQYLIRAEAYIQNINCPGIADINTIRARARASATATVPNPLPALSTHLPGSRP